MISKQVRFTVVLAIVLCASCYFGSIGCAAEAGTSVTILPRETGIFQAAVEQGQVLGEKVYASDMEQESDFADTAITPADDSNPNLIAPAPATTKTTARAATGDVTVEIAVIALVALLLIILILIEKDRRR